MTAEMPWEPVTGVVEVEGARLAYRIEGRGPTCLVVGSIPYYARCFSRALRERVRLVFVEPRHFAPSDRGYSLAQISMDTYAADIDRVRQVVGLGRVVVIGHSSHAAIALEYARRYPANVRGVVITGAAPYVSDEEHRAAVDHLWEAEASDERKALQARASAALTLELRATLTPADLFRREYLAEDPSRWFDPAYDGSWLWEGVELNMAVLERLLAAFDGLAVEPGEVTAPMLIIHGMFDYANPYTLWEPNLYKFPSHTYVLLDRSGHTPSLEEPERFDQALVAWVQGLS